MIEEIERRAPDIDIGAAGDIAVGRCIAEIEFNPQIAAEIAAYGQSVNLPGTFLKTLATVRRGEAYIGRPQGDVACQFANLSDRQRCRHLSMNSHSTLTIPTLPHGNSTSDGLLNN
jgi:hypothetical protein